MARILWLCRLAAWRGSTMFAPIIMQLQGGTNGFFATAFTTTDAIRGQPWALGVAEVTSAQLAEIQADNRIFTFLEATQRLLRFNQLTNPQQNAVNAFLAQIGIALPAPTETIDAILNRIVATNESMKNLETMLAELARELERQA
jgi:hypothetical protein